MAMPKAACNEITIARDRLNAAVRLVVWSMLVLVWLVLGAWWAIPVALLGMAWGYWRALDAAGTYGELLRAAFDVYRAKLYRELKWPLGANDKARGEALTQFLWRGY
jgi:hypothetical protein